MEFNKAALSLSDALSSEQRQGALNRLLKVRPLWYQTGALAISRILGRFGSCLSK